MVDCDVVCVRGDSISPRIHNHILGIRTTPSGHPVRLGPTCRKARHVALVDPQSITVNAVANSLPRVSAQGSASIYSKDDGNLKLTVSSTTGKRTRRLVRIDSRKTAVDPLFPAQNVPYNMAAYLVVETPSVGYTIAEQKQIVDALSAWLTASSGANVTKVLGGES